MRWSTYDETVRVAMSSFRFHHHGGIERASYELATELAAQGVDVELVAAGVEPDPPSPLTWRRVPMPPLPAFLAPAVYPPKATRALRGESFDILHNQGGCALRRQDVITAHSCHRAWWTMKFRQGEAARAILNPHHRAVLRTERLNYRPDAYERVIAVSAGVARELTQFYGVPPERIRVIPNAVDAARFRPHDAEARGRRVRERWLLDADAVVLLWVGKEFRRKGLEPLIRSLPELPAKVVALVVGGDDQRPYRALADELGVASRVVFAGPTNQVEDYFAAGDIFVFPTLYEAFALVTLEAAAAGLPIVATSVNGTEDFIVDGRNGIFIERDPHSIAAAVGPLVADPDRRRRMGEAARRAVEPYTWASVAERTRGVYDEVLTARAAR